MNFGLLDPRFKYVPAAHTDIRATFERVRKQLEEAAKKAAKKAQKQADKAVLVAAVLSALPWESLHV